MICNACGYENNEDGQFCSQCGLPLSIDENDLSGERPERPKLNDKVPYVIPGEKTGYIPALNADEDPDAEDFQSDDVEDIIAATADDSACDEDAEDSKGSAVLEAEQSAEESEEGDASEEAEKPEEVEESKGSEDPEELEEDAADLQDVQADDAQESAIGEAAQSTAQLTVPIPVKKMASWDEDFPVTQNTAVMPEVSDLDGEDAEDETFLDGEPSQGAEEDSLSVGEESDAKNEGEESGSENSECDSSAEAQDDPVDSNDEAADEDEKASSTGKHAKNVQKDISNDPTVKLDRVPSSDPSSTAVIPSIAVSGPRRYTDSNRDSDKRKISTRTMATIVAVAVVALLAIILGVRSCGSGIQVPDVVGMPSQEARARLESAGFEVEVESQIVEDAESGSVLECSPKAGSKRSEGSVVTLTVAASQVVPDVVGVDLDTATSMLQEQGAENIQVKAEASNQPENTVTAVSPKAGEPFELEDEIILTVATSATMPDVVGMVQADAESTLKDAGYKTEVKWVDSEKDPGVILATEPKAGELANLGSTVKLEMASPGPSNILHIMEYFQIAPQDLSSYLQWKGFSVAGSYSYPDALTGEEYVSQVWLAKDGSTVSFTPAPYIEDKGLDMADYLGQGLPFQGVRIFIPANSNLSLGADSSMATIEKYMEACGLSNLTDSCTVSDLEYNGQPGSELGIGGNLICAQGEQDGRIWTILITEAGTYIGAGGLECYSDMLPICDAVAVNEVLTAQS